MGINSYVVQYNVSYVGDCPGRPESEIGEVATPKRKMRKKKRQTFVPSEHGSPSRFPLHNQSIDTSALGKLVKAG